MKLSHARIACMLLLTISYTTIESIEKSTRASTLRKMHLDHPVRVLLQEKPSGEILWTFSSSHGFFLYNPHTKMVQRIHDKELLVTRIPGAFIANGKRYPYDQLFLIPNKGLISFESIPYEGTCALHDHEGRASLVNHIGLEDYLAAVLPYESIPSWPDEVQKALCIACRTYAVYKIQSERNDSLPYDLKNTVLDQVYRGQARKTSLKKIVDETKGIIITHEGKPILAMYSAVCGSIIPAEKKSSIYTKAPYLKRPYACTHCKDQPLYSWKTTYTLKELEGPLQKVFYGLGQLKEIHIKSYDHAGIAQQLVLTGSKKTVLMCAHDFRMLFLKIRSLCCTFSTKNGILIAQGRGHGHHIGLCQWGAYTMANLGNSYQEILEFYYPETSLAAYESLGAVTHIR